MSKITNKNTLELGSVAQKSNPRYREYLKRKEDEKEEGFVSSNEFNNLESKDTLKD
jgi:type III secretory pathway component EscR